MKEDRDQYLKSNKLDYEHTNEEEPLNYEFSCTSYESLNRQFPPYFPNPNTPFFPGNMPPPPNNNQNSNGMPLGGPPNYIPAKNDKGVQQLSSEKDSKSSLKSVSPNSISFCLYKFTYIWETSGRSYWAYLLNVDKQSASGFRWLGRTWVYFGVDLKKVDSFVCYRSSDEDCDCADSLYRSIDDDFEITKQEYSLSEVREVYSKTLAYVDIPETKNDFIVETIGNVEGKSIQSKIPCKKSRVTSYRVILEVSYPDTLDESTKESINDIVDDAYSAALDTLKMSRSKDKYFNPLELFNNSVKLIPSALKAFSNKFKVCIKKLPDYDEMSKYVTYSIRREKDSSKWKNL